MKYIIPFFLVIFSSLSPRAQVYVKLKKNVQAKNDAGITIPANAILELVKKEDGSYVKYFSDEYRLDNNDYVSINVRPRFISIKDSIVQLTKDNIIVFNIKFLRDSGYGNPVNIMNETGKKLMVFQKDVFKEFSKDSLPEKFELTSSGFADIFFFKNQLRPTSGLYSSPPLPPPNDVTKDTGIIKGTPGTVNNTVNPFYNDLWFWLFILILVLVSALIFYSSFIRKNGEFETKSAATHKLMKAKSVENYIKAKNISIKDFIEWNQEINGKKWASVEELTQILGKSKYNFVIGPEKTEAQETNNIRPADNDITGWLKYFDNKLDTYLKNNSDNVISEQLKVQLEQKETVVDKLKAAQDENNRQIAGLKEDVQYFSERMIRADELQQTGSHLFDFMIFLQSLYKDCDSFYQECLALDKQNPNTQFVWQLISKYNAAVAAIPQYYIGKWQQISATLKETSCIADKELVRMFSKQKLNTQDKIDLFRRIVYKEMLESYVSASVILCDELAHLDRFTNKKDDITTKAAHKFDKIIRTLLNNSRNDVDLEINYLPLFVSYEPYSEFVKVVDEPLGSLYKNIENIERNQVIEVKAYGFKRKHNFESPDTKVVIKK